MHIGGYFARVREDQVALRNELPSASVLGTAFTAADRSHGTAQDPACRMPRPRRSTLSAAEAGVLPGAAMHKYATYLSRLNHRMKPRGGGPTARSSLDNCALTAVRHNIEIGFPVAGGSREWVICARLRWMSPAADWFSGLPD
jgi:hypothetical protein